MNVWPNYPSSLFVSVSEKQGHSFNHVVIQQTFVDARAGSWGRASCLPKLRPADGPGRKEQMQLEAWRGQGVRMRSNFSEDEEPRQGGGGRLGQGQSHRHGKQQGALETQCEVWKAGAGGTGGKPRASCRKWEVSKGSGRVPTDFPPTWLTGEGTRGAMRILSKVKSPVNAERRVSQDPAWGQRGWQCHSQKGGRCLMESLWEL